MHVQDMARLSRWMAGKAVGLVLSGGGSRGLAHLGVLHALDDAGIPVDVIGGTSQGAYMAALYAQVRCPRPPASMRAQGQLPGTAAAACYLQHEAAWLLARAAAACSQAALRVQGLRWDRMHGIVQAYSKQMGSIRHLLSDLTLPLISVFSGHGFDHVVRESFAQGAQQIEDLWLR